MSKKMYVYEYLDRCDPNSGAYHEQGGLIVVTAGYPNDAVPLGTGNSYKVAEHGGETTKYGLPEASRVIEVSDDTEDLVVAFPDSGCC